MKDRINAASPFEEVREGMILGNQPFVDWIFSSTERKKEIKKIPREEHMIGRLSLGALFTDVNGRSE